MRISRLRTLQPHGAERLGRNFRKEQTMKDAIEQAWRNWHGDFPDYLVPEINPFFERGFEDGCRFANRRADALAATIRALGEVVTNGYESKEQFVERVRDILGADPDDRTHANEFLRMASRGSIVCDICGGIMLPMYGGGWDNDRLFCGNLECGAKIVFPTSTAVG